MRMAFVCPGADSQQTLINHGPWVQGEGCYVQAWLNVLGGDYWTGSTICDGGVWQEIDNYDVILLNQNTTQYSLICDLAARAQHAKVIAYQDGSVDDMTIIGMPSKIGLVQSLRACDMMMVYQTYAPDYFSLYTDKPVKYVGFPVPVDFIKSFRKPMSERKNFVMIGTHIGTGGADRNGISSNFAVQKALPNVPMYCQYYDPVEVAFAKQFLPTLHQEHCLGQPQYYELLSQARMAVHLDHRHTFGRFAMECACLGIPCVGTNRNATQSHLFGSHLTFKEPFMQMGEIVQRIKWVWDNPERLPEGIEKRIDFYRDERLRERFFDAVKEIGVVE